MGHYPGREGIVDVSEIRDIFSHMLLVAGGLSGLLTPRGTGGGLTPSTRD
jgi:hypothetical protein